MRKLIADSSGPAVPVQPITKSGLAGWLASAAAAAAAWVVANQFDAEPGTQLAVPDANGEISLVLAGISEPAEIWDLAALPRTLPEQAYRIDDRAGVLAGDAAAPERLALGWLLGCYAFERYKKATRGAARLVQDAGVEVALIEAEATFLVRDLVNTPANDMGPSALAAAARKLAERFGAGYGETVGDALIEQGYPAIHAVGRAAADQPRLIELSWGDPGRPTVALVGKGVCFDSGGLDLKAAANMRLMKKDMGGAAHVLGLAHIIMAKQLNLHLKVLIPAVENSVAGNAMRPLDVVRTRAGINVEIGNTDAEGRVILADALTRAGEAKPELVLDFATLTGAARVALGPELPALFSNDDDLAADSLAAAAEVSDPMWRMPLWPGYRKLIESKVADINNSPEGGFAGAITAALFLERFAPAGAAWAHADIMAWNVAAKPGRPEGGEAMGMRAFARMLEDRYARR
ncbi:MAG: leucyl aminopeptidase family protein [Proteobacteria bacterium]|nr:leucyl aminopeptidase family protein [Pseudomonadota bacterium]